MTQGRQQTNKQIGRATLFFLMDKSLKFAHTWLNIKKLFLASSSSWSIVYVLPVSQAYHHNSSKEKKFPLLSNVSTWNRWIKNTYRSCQPTHTLSSLPFTRGHLSNSLAQSLKKIFWVLHTQTPHPTRINCATTPL